MLFSFMCRIIKMFEIFIQTNAQYQEIVFETAKIEFGYDTKASHHSFRIDCEAHFKLN